VLMDGACVCRVDVLVMDGGRVCLCLSFVAW